MVCSPAPNAFFKRCGGRNARSKTNWGDVVRGELYLAERLPNLAEGSLSSPPSPSPTPTSTIPPTHTDTPSLQRGCENASSPLPPFPWLTRKLPEPMSLARLIVHPGSQSKMLDPSVQLALCSHTTVSQLKKVCTGCLDSIPFLPEARTRVARFTSLCQKS